MRTCTDCTSEPGVFPALAQATRPSATGQKNARRLGKAASGMPSPSGAQHAFDGRPDLRKAAMPLGRERAMPSARLPVPG